jgi:glucose uptake protein GlcU
MVVLGFLAELVGIILLAERRTPATLAVMVAGLVLVMSGIVFSLLSRRRR